MPRPDPAARRLPALLALALVAELLLLLPARPAAAQDVTDGLVLRYDLTRAVAPRPSLETTGTRRSELLPPGTGTGPGGFEARR